MNKQIFYLFSLILIAFFLVGATGYTAFAEESKSNEEKATYTIIPKPDLIPGPGFDVQKSKNAKSILVDTILPAFGVGMIGFVGGMSLIFLVIAGVRFTISYGNDEDITKAKDQARYALIGLVIAILSYAIVRIITNIKIEGNETTYNPNIEITNVV